MKKRSSIVLVCVIVIVIALAGIVGLNSLKENKIKESESNNKKVTTTEVITKNTDKEKETTT